LKEEHHIDWAEGQFHAIGEIASRTTWRNNNTKPKRNNADCDKVQSLLSQQTTLIYCHPDEARDRQFIVFQSKPNPWKAGLDHKLQL